VYQQEQQQQQQQQQQEQQDAENPFLDPPFSRIKNFFTQILFSEWIIEMDHHDCTMGGGGWGYTSDETSL
jgi:hypothetical protein